MTPDGAKRSRLAYRFGAAHAKRPGPFLGQERREGRESRSRREFIRGDCVGIAGKEAARKKAAATLRKFEGFMSFAIPALGSRPIGEISAREILSVLKEVEAP
jgi:hypothetical protein